MLNRLTPARRNAALLAILAAVLWFAWSVRSALNPLLLAFLFAYMLHPLVLTLERRGWSRKGAVNVIYGAAALSALVATFALFAQGRQLWRDLAREDGLLPRLEARLEGAFQAALEFADEWTPGPRAGAPPGAASGAVETPPGAASGAVETPPGDAPSGASTTASASEPQADPGLQNDAGPGSAPGAARLDGTAGAGAGADGAVDGQADGDEPRSGLASLVAEAREWLSSGEGRNAARRAGTAAAGGLWVVLRRLFGSLLTFLTLAFLVPVYTWFLLFELERIARFVRGYVPVEQRERAAHIGEQIAGVLGNFFRGRLLVCLLKGLILAAALAVLRVPYAFLLGMLSGALSLIPFAGPLIGYGLALLLALLEFTPLGALWRIAVVFALGELVEGYVLVPRILGDSLGLHPLVVLVSLTVAGAALGMFGLLLALPLTAAVIILAREVVLPAAKDWAEGRRGRDRAGASPELEV